MRRREMVYWLLWLFFGPLPCSEKKTEEHKETRPDNWCCLCDGAYAAPNSKICNSCYEIAKRL